jgi:hypothetical protein
LASSQATRFPAGDQEYDATGSYSIGAVETSWEVVPPASSVTASEWCPAPSERLNRSFVPSGDQTGPPRLSALATTFILPLSASTTVIWESARKASSCELGDQVAENHVSPSCE